MSYSNRFSGAITITPPLTHAEIRQAPRATAACRPVLLAQHPQLAGVQPPDGMGVPALLAWIAEQEERFGERLPVSPAVHWERRNPIVELVEMVGPERVVVVAMPEPDRG